MSALDLERIEDTETQAPAGPSALARIRKLYQSKVDEQVIDLAVPRNPLLRIRYHAFDPDNAPTTGRNQHEVNLDVLINACKAILIRENGEWVELEDESGPVGFDESLSEMLGLGVPSVDDGGTARQVVEAVFRRAPMPQLAIEMQVEQLTEWLAGGGSSVDEVALLGES